MKIGDDLKPFHSMVDLLSNQIFTKMTRLKSVGKCVFCEKPFAKRSISRHLGTHLETLPEEAKKKSLHLRVEAGPYFLNLLVSGSTSLGTLDDYLRKIWLECCGHLSQFGYVRWDEEMDMGTPIQKELEEGGGLWYAYDFGSTTELVVKCLGEYPVATPEGIRLLSRNEPLEIWCDACGKKPALYICSVHWDEDSQFCEACSEKHEEECEGAEYAMMEIYNSPRSGTCAYAGGAIDLERDGVFMPKNK